MSDPTHSDRRPGAATGWSHVVAVMVAAAAALCTILIAFGWPALVAEPRDVRVAITGPDPFVSQVESVSQQAGGAIELVRVADRGAAVTAIEERDVVGAVLIDPRSPEVLIASAAGTGPRQLMDRLTQGLQARLDQAVAAGEAPTATITITDVAPFGSDDPTGARFGTAALPLVLGGILGGALVAFGLIGAVRQFTGVIGYALIGGFGLGAILQLWFGALAGTYLLNSLAIALVLASIATVVLGLARLLGPRGVGIAAVLFVLLGIPISGALTPLQFLPQPWEAVGLSLPPGAAIDLLRNLSFFPDAPTTAGWSVLGGWAVAGLVLLLVSTRASVPGDRPGRSAHQQAGDQGGQADQQSGDHDGPVPTSPDRSSRQTALHT